MQRLAIILLICLILGAIAQTLVAWSCALWVEPVYMGETESAEKTEMQFVGDGPNGTQSGTLFMPNYVTYHFRGFGVSQDATHEMTSGAATVPIVHVWSGGWPMRSLKSTLEHAELAYKLGNEWWLRPLDPLTTNGHSTLPLTPVFIGFSANTALFGLVLFVLFLAHRRVVMMIRARRNRCVRCNYDLRAITADRCPECGYVRPAKRIHSHVNVGQ